MEEKMMNLIIRHLMADIGKDEEAALFDWVNRSADNRALFEQMKNVWDNAGDEINKEDIDVYRALDNVLVRLNLKERRGGFRYYFRKIAAVLFLPLLLGSLGLYYFSAGMKPAEQPVVQQFNTIRSAYGNRTELILSDGTTVLLDAKSTLRYPVDFTGETREVYLEGQAYFEVASDETKPFIVNTRRLRVRATGTTFDVSDYESREESQVTLVEGKVAVLKMINDTANVLVADLAPDQHLVYNSSSDEVDVENNDAYEHIAWKDGKLIFRNVPMEKVVEKLSEVFEVDIELKDTSLKNYRYRATFQDETLSEILKLLKYSSPIDYVELKRSPLPDGSFEPRKVIIFRDENKQKTYCCN